MSERISAVIYYDGESIDFTEFRKRIKCKIFGTTPSSVSSIKYRFCDSIDTVTYDSFDIKGGRSFKAIVQTHLASGLPYLELYVQFSSPNEIFATSTSTVVQEEYTTPTRHSISERQNMEAPVFGGKVALFSKSKPVLSEPEDVEVGSNEEEEDPRFRAYSPPAHMHNVDISADNELEFLDLPHKMRDRTGSSLDLGELEVGKEFSNKDSFINALKQHSINHGVNYNVDKSKSEKFGAKCAMQIGTCSWKIMASFRKKTDHPKMDSAMIANLILPMLKADPRTSVSCIIASIRSQLRYMPSYRKAWIAKQKAVENMHSGWDASYNEVWQRCQVLKRYTHGLLLAVAQDGGGRILPITFAITPGESVGVVVAPVVGVGKMTHLGKIKNVEVFASPTAEVFESYKAMGISNEMSSPMKPRAIPSATMAYISSVESESSGKEMHRAMHSNLA
ncbi:hypothetical protein PVK06_019301 [Gossypium arboreum]|uniref:Transposase MuDR plant domain-containing protein n=1 Tax=Gossypium arboreum TaxID=29729 RepID=A0ABR0PJP0_GOSAR|nr:hypothetical protein PVK06_019301 [Gossypium arboreum]